VYASMADVADTLRCESAHNFDPARDADTDDEQDYYSPERYVYLATLFLQTHHALFSLPAMPLLHTALSAGLTALKTPACHSAYASSSSNTSSMTTRLCPICSTELNELARNLPYAHHSQSFVEHDPLVLPNGRIYGRDRLEDVGRKMNVVDGIVRDPTTGEEFGWGEVGKVYIL